MVDHYIKHFGKYILCYIIILFICYVINALETYKSYKAGDTNYLGVAGVILPPIAIVNTLSNIKR